MSRTPKQQKSTPSAAVVKHSRKEEGGGRSHSGKRGPRARPAETEGTRSGEGGRARAQERRQPPEAGRDGMCPSLSPPEEPALLTTAPQRSEAACRLPSSSSEGKRVLFKPLGSW